MKQFLILLTTLIFLCALTACGGTQTQNSQDNSRYDPETVLSENENSAVSSAPVTSSTPDEEESSANGETKVLVAYFSATGNTEGIAQHLQTILNADLYEIVPEIPYTEEDLNYGDDDCRANQEQNDPSARPTLSGTLENPEDYGVVFLGYPIWWGQAPKILYTFLESCDFGDAIVIPFCTSGSSNIGSSAEGLQALTENAQWMEGQRFSGGASEEEIAQWVEKLDLNLS